MSKPFWLMNHFHSIGKHFTSRCCVMLTSRTVRVLNPGGEAIRTRREKLLPVSNPSGTCPEHNPNLSLFRPDAAPGQFARWIKTVKTIGMLLKASCDYAGHWTTVHLVAGWIQIGRLAGQLTGKLKAEGALKPLVQQTLDAVRAEGLGTRELANIAYAAARCGSDKCVSTLFAVFRKAL